MRVCRYKEKAMSDTFYAITSLGWGVGNTPTEAHEKHDVIQRRHFPSLTDFDLAEAWGFVWQVPSGTSGHHFGVEGLYWEFDEIDRHSELSTPEQRVAYIGNVPDFARTIEEEE